MGGQRNNTRGYDMKEGRRQAQARDVEDKRNREIDYFWSMQARNKQNDQERGGAPRKAKRTLDAEERELFEEKAGMSAGIDFDKYDSIAVEVNGADRDKIPICSTFEEIGQKFRLDQWLMDNIRRCHYTRPTPVQKYSISTGLMGYDMMTCAQTGSGKTAAFLCPIAMSLDPEWACEATRETYQGPAEPMALVLAPTRELCSQIYDEARKLFHRSVFKVSQCYGGVDAKIQLRDMSRGTDLLLATPGRLIDFIDRDVVTMQSVVFLCLDEADRMLDMGFEPQIRQIVEERDMQGKENRQTMMFSATFPKEIQQLAGSFMRQGYMWISVGRVGAAAESVTQEFVPIGGNGMMRGNDKIDCLIKELEEMQSLGQKEKVLVFVAMKRTCPWLSNELYRKFRYQAVEIHGDMEQPQRERSLQQFKSGDRPILIATEVAARGLDIPHVSKVINFDMPKLIDDYVHRIGRTGRCGNRGKAVSFVALGDTKNPDTDFLPELCTFLDESSLPIPQWMEDEALSSKNRGKWKTRNQNWRNGGQKNGFGQAHRDFRGGAVQRNHTRGGSPKGGKNNKGSKGKGKTGRGEDRNDNWRNGGSSKGGGKNGGNGFGGFGRSNGGSNGFGGGFPANGRF